MAGRIPQQFIDDLLARTDIVDVIDERVPLKKAGREFKACCPFHTEKTPSFTVSPSKQFYYCFGCGASGTALGFLMDYAHLGFTDAVHDLAGRLNLEVPTEGGGPVHGSGHEEIYAMLARAADWFRAQLRQHPSRENAVAYLRNRGLSGDIAADYGIGYAPPGYHNQMEALGGDGRQLDLMEKAGLLARRDNGRRYDKFRERIMFPILDRRGRTVGFGGRVLGDAEPKYLNSPETPVFHKGREIYGLYELRLALRAPERVFVVEGYMDVVALAQHGIRNVVATLGTAATAEHLQQLFRVSADVVFCFDGDKAGRKAAWRALEHALPLMQEGRQALFMFLPEGEDPDSLVRGQGADAFQQLAEQAKPMSAYFFRELTGQTKLNSEEGRARLVELARPYLEKIPPGAFRQLMARRLTELVRMELGEVQGLLRGQPPQLHTQRRRGRRPLQTRSLSLVARLITALLHYPDLAQSVADTTTLRAVSRPGAALLADMLDLLHSNPELNTAAVVERFRDTEHHQHLRRLAAVEDLGEFWSDRKAQFTDGLGQLHTQEDASRYRELLEKSRSEELTDDERSELRGLLALMGRSKGA